MTKAQRKAVGRRIREARLACNLSQTDLAARASLQGQTIYRYEAGRLTPSLAALVALADACGVSTDWIAKGVGPGPEPADGPPQATGTEG